MSAQKSSKKDLQLTSQSQMEELFSKHQVMPFIRDQFRSAGVIKELKALDVPVNFGLDLMAYMVLYKRANVPTLVGLLRSYFQNEETPEQACTDALLNAIEKDLVDFDLETKVFIIKYDLDDLTRQKLDQFQYPLPMIEHPEPVSSNRETGYQSIPGSLILKDNHHEGDICLDHINRMNDIPLKLNADIVAFVQNKWKHIDKMKPDESYDDFKKRQKAFAKYDRTSREVLSALMAAGNHFWLTHKYDKRGRTYSQGYHVNYQGNDWNKACIEFADGEPLNDYRDANP